jgi:hypothetical protein
MPPDAFGISSNRARIVGQCSFRWPGSPPTVILSTPAAPLLRFTCANAFFRFSRSTTASIDGPVTVGRSRPVFAALASVSRTAALRASAPRQKRRAIYSAAARCCNGMTLPGSLGLAQ